MLELIAEVMPFPASDTGMSYACPQQRPTAILQPQRSPKQARGRQENPEIPASALLAQLVEHFHGKEGVVGSSPTEGLGIWPA
jgi:hypothetical protein